MTTLSVAQVAAKLDVAPCVVRGWADRGLLPCRYQQHGNRSGPNRVFDEADLEELLSRTGLPPWHSPGYPVLRLWSRIRQDENGCWVNIGTLNSGEYASIFVDGRTRPAHRFMYEEVFGPVPDELHMDHLCRNPACCNPWHLEPVTCAENLRRGVGFSGLNARKTHCPAGHPLVEGNLCAEPRGRKCLTCHRLRERVRRARLKAERAQRQEAA